MGFLQNLGVKGVEGSVNFNGVGSTIGIILVCFVILVFVGGITFFYYSKKIKKNVFKITIPLFTRIHGKLSRIGIDTAKELFIPDSNISLFFLKDRKIYLARPTRAMGKDEYWEYISENGEFVNFDLSMLSENDTLAQANYDHRDTRYAYTNLKEIIKRNYKDKAIVWWKDPTIMNIISFAIMSIIFVAGVILILSRVGKMIEGLLPISENFKIAAENMIKAVQISQNLNSGIVGA